jgi:hypothetical protein
MQQNKKIIYSGLQHIDYVFVVLLITLFGTYLPLAVYGASSSSSSSSSTGSGNINSISSSTGSSSINTISSSSSMYSSSSSSDTYVAGPASSDSGPSSETWLFTSMAVVGFILFLLVLLRRKIQMRKQWNNNQNTDQIHPNRYPNAIATVAAGANGNVNNGGYAYTHTVENGHTGSQVSSVGIGANAYTNVVQDGTESNYSNDYKQNFDTGDSENSSMNSRIKVPHTRTHVSLLSSFDERNELPNESIRTYYTPPLQPTTNQYSTMQPIPTIVPIQHVEDNLIHPFEPEPEET